MAKTTLTLAELKNSLGKEVATSDWFTIDQARIDAFADAGLDHQWIHIDPERAARDSPFGGAVAHGFLTLSLLSYFRNETLQVEGTRMGVNYGLNRVRFVSPVPAGARVRARFTLIEIEDLPRGVQTTWNVVVEREGGDKPAMIAEWLTRHHW